MNILVCRAIIHRSIPVRLNQVLLFTAISKYNVGYSVKLIFFPKPKIRISNKINMMYLFYNQDIGMSVDNVYNKWTIDRKIIIIYVNYDD